MYKFVALSVCADRQMNRNETLFYFYFIILRIIFTIYSTDDLINAWQCIDMFHSM